MINSVDISIHTSTQLPFISIVSLWILKFILQSASHLLSTLHKHTHLFELNSVYFQPNNIGQISFYCEQASNVNIHTPKIDQRKAKMRQR